MADENTQIKKQIEFYFGDSNFPKDKFLRAQAAQNEEGYVSIATLITFSKLKALNVDIAKAIESVKDSESVVVNPEGTMIKRKNPLPENDTSSQRTIYAKGFVPGTSIDDISAKFAHVGKVLSVRIRKFADKSPKPSAFIEFSNPEEAAKAINEKIQVEGKDLELLTKDAFNEQKKAEKEQKKKKRKDPEDGKEGKEEEDSKKPKKDKIEKRFPKGVFLEFKDIGTGVDRELIKKVFGDFENSKVAYVDFEKDQLEGVARFEDAEAAKRVLDGMTSSKTELGGKVPTLTILEGEAEEAHYQRVKESQAARFKKGGKSNRGKKRQRF